jgi:hypothetical protein
VAGSWLVPGGLGWRAGREQDPALAEDADRREGAAWPRCRLERSGGSMAAEAAIQDANAKPGCPTTKIRHQSRRVLLARRDLSRPDSDGNARAKQGGRSVEDGNGHGSGRGRSVARLDLSE